MKKQILSISLAAALAVSCTGIAMAEDKTPTVFVNQGQIFFDDQAPVILGEGTTLVPARGVFEAMGAKVEWKEDTRTVDVTSSDNKTLIRLTIDDSTMKVFDVSGVFGALMSGQDFVAPENDVTLDVAPQIISDRTMIPLRAISEALDADVQWNGEDYTINITTANAPSADAGVPALSLSADKLTAALLQVECVLQPFHGFCHRVFQRCLIDRRSVIRRDKRIAVRCGIAGTGRIHRLSLILLLHAGKRFDRPGKLCVVKGNRFFQFQCTLSKQNHRPCEGVLIRQQFFYLPVENRRRADL